MEIIVKKRKILFEPSEQQPQQRQLKRPRRFLRHQTSAERVSPASAAINVTPVSGTAEISGDEEAKNKSRTNKQNEIQKKRGSRIFILNFKKKIKEISFFKKMSSDAVGSCEKLCMAIKHLPSLAAGEKGGKLKKEEQHTR